MSLITVFYLERSFIITNETGFKQEVQTGFTNPEDIIKFLHVFESDHKIKQSVFYTQDPGRAWEIFLTDFNMLEAAGGIVINPQHEMLVIHRLGKWDLPKGKIEPGESPQETAYREIAEECGIHKHVLQERICETYHTYTLASKKILKKTHWFSFYSEEKEPPVPQTEEKIETACWMKPEDFCWKLEHSYPSIQQVMTKAYRKPGFLSPLKT